LGRKYEEEIALQRLKEHIEERLKAIEDEENDPERWSEDGKELLEPQVFSAEDVKDELEAILNIIKTYKQQH